MNGVHHRHEFLPQGQKHFITYQEIDSLRSFDVAWICKLGPNPEQDSAEAEDSTNVDRILQVPNYSLISELLLTWEEETYAKHVNHCEESQKRKRHFEAPFNFRETGRQHEAPTGRILSQVCAELFAQ